MIFEKQILNIYKSFAYTRCDDLGLAYYFTSDDFPELRKEEYPFKSSMGHTLQGYIYYYDNPVQDKLVVFDHGFGGGHESYMKEIEMLCKSGFKVFAYDHTGCMASGGDTPNGMAQSLRDLDDCIKEIKVNDELKSLDIYVIGHSWGGFSTLNISKLHNDIKKVVVISGFVSVTDLVNSFFSGILKGYRKIVLELENRSNPEFVRYNAVSSLKDTTAEVLLIYSSNDNLCKKDPHYDLLFENLKDKSNIKFLLVNNKGHNPNYTEDAVKYLGEYIKKKNKLSKKLKTKEDKENFVASFDWNKMTEQDPIIWDTIINHLK